MQAHHIISVKGVELSGLVPYLIESGYDINSLPNLVLLPITLQGACHLGVQVHRRIRNTPMQPTEGANDAHESPMYDIKVADRLADLSWPLDMECREKNSKTVIKLLQELSEEILEAVQKTPTEMPLTAVAHHLKPRSFIGCGGYKSDADLNKHPRMCPQKRNHLASCKMANQSSEGITFTGDYPYVLRPGR